MRKKILLTILYLGLMNYDAHAQSETTTKDDLFGKGFNIGVGTGYYRHLIGTTFPLFTCNYEFSFTKKITLAPFIGTYSHTQAGGYYNQRTYLVTETTVPIGVKGYYYFNRHLHAESKWDFYGAASLILNLRNISWEPGFQGDKSIFPRESRGPWLWETIFGTQLLNIGLHIGCRYHLNDKIGIFIDLSTSVSTVGITF